MIGNTLVSVAIRVAHAGDVHLRAQCEVHGSCLAALAAVEEATGCFAVLC